MESLIAIAIVVAAYGIFLVAKRITRQHTYNTMSAKLDRIEAEIIRRRH